MENGQETFQNDGEAAALRWLYEEGESAYRPPVDTRTALDVAVRGDVTSESEPPRRRRRWPLVTGVCAIALVGGVAAYALWTPREDVKELSLDEPVEIAVAEPTHERGVVEETPRSTVSDAAIALNDRGDSVVMKFAAESENVDAATLVLLDSDSKDALRLTVPASEDGVLSVGAKLTVEDTLRIASLKLLVDGEDVLSSSLRMRLESSLRDDVDTLKTRINEEKRAVEEAERRVKDAASSAESSADGKDTSYADAEPKSEEPTQPQPQAQPQREQEQIETKSAVASYLEGSALESVAEKLESDAKAKSVDVRLLPAIASVQTELGAFTSERYDWWGLGEPFMSPEDAVNAAFAALGSSKTVDYDVAIAFGVSDLESWTNAVKLEMERIGA